MCCYVSFWFEAVSCGTCEEGWKARDVDIKMGDIIAGIAGKLLTITLGWDYMKGREEYNKKMGDERRLNAYGRRRNQSQGYSWSSGRSTSFLGSCLRGRSTAFLDIHLHLRFTIGCLPGSLGRLVRIFFFTYLL